MIISDIKDFEKELPKFESQIKGNDELFSENETPAVLKRLYAILANRQMQ